MSGGRGQDALPGFDVAGATHVGRVRTRNEDHFLTAQLRKTVEVLDTNLDPGSTVGAFDSCDAWLLLVADGVGGSQSGGEASVTAVEVLGEHLQRVVGCYYADAAAEDLFLVSLEEAVARAHDRVREAHPGRGAASTTLTLAVVVWPRAYTVHVGDSRLYLQRGTRLRQVTQDQTLAELLVGGGHMTEKAADAAGMGNVLTGSIGGDHAQPSVGILDLAAGDSLLLCTDGLTRHVDDDRLASVLAAADDARSAVDTCIAEALAGGGRDNVSVIVLRAGEATP